VIIDTYKNYISHQADADWRQYLARDSINSVSFSYKDIRICFFLKKKVEAAGKFQEHIVRLALGYHTGTDRS
jgi:hypothetical protein